MNWLKKKVIQWVREDWEEERKKNGAERAISVRDTDHVEADPIISFRIYSAQNGKILEFSKYDRVKDRSDRSVYIIGKDEDIAEKVGKCLSLELLR
jgi:hypothetical protein